MNYQFKKECKWIIIPMNTKKFNLNLTNNLPKKIKVTSFFFLGLDNADIYQLNIPFLWFSLFAEGQTPSFNYCGLQWNISYPINSGDYYCNIIDYEDNWVATTGYCIINIIFYYD